MLLRPGEILMSRLASGQLASVLATSYMYEIYM